MKIRFTVHGRPQQRGSKRATLIPDKKGGFRKRPDGKPIIVARDDNEKSGDWMNSVRAAAAEHRDGELLGGALRLTCWFYFQRPKSHFGSGRNADRLKPSAPAHHVQAPDLSKLIRCLEDALTGVIWVDDRQVCGYGSETGKFWTTTGECAEIVIEELES